MPKYEKEVGEFYGVKKTWGEKVRDSAGTETILFLESSLQRAEHIINTQGLGQGLQAGTLIKYENSRGPMEKTGGDVKLPESPNHSIFYEFDMVDEMKKEVFVDGKRHGFRVVLDVQESNNGIEIQAGWMTSAHYGTDGSKKKGWKFIKGYGAMGRKKT